MKIYNNVLSHSTILIYNKEIETLVKHNVWKSSDYLWDPGLSAGLSGQCISTQSTDYLLDSVVRDIKNILPAYSSISIQHCIWHKNSGIQMHDDSHCLFGATIYMNKTWHPEWGGLFLWKVSDTLPQLKGLIPAYNSIVINKDKVNHMVTPINSNAPENRITMQLWAG